MPDVKRMTGMAPTGDKLYAALDELRQAPNVGEPRHHGAWRAVMAFLRQDDPRGSEDARQETIINVVRAVSSFKGHSPGEAVRWLRTVHRHRTFDGWRVEGRNPLRDTLERAPRDSDHETPPLENVPAPEPTHREHAAGALAHTSDLVFARLEAQLENHGVSASKRLLRRLQARAAWLRLVHEEDAPAIEAALAPHAAPSRDALYKWIERGRAVLLDVADAWLAELDGDDSDARLVPEVLRQLVEVRRADAGVARPARRKP